MLKRLRNAALIFLIAASVFLGAQTGFGGWDPAVPANDELFEDTPALLRSNWAAIALGTDAALQITNAKVAAGAGIVDTKLATITSPNKVNASSLYSFSSAPAGAGAWPILNGGTGQTTATAALAALLPNQSGQAGKGLVSNGTVQSWGYPAGLDIASQLQGDIVIFNGSSWIRLGPGTIGQALITGGAGANPAWGYPASLSLASQASGDTAYYDGAIWKRLAKGTAGQYLKQGASYPEWGAGSGSQLFTSSGTFTAPAGVTQVYVSLVGGGAGGGKGYTTTSEGGGGGGGGFRSDALVLVTGSGTYSVTVGAGGTGGTTTWSTANNATAGGTSSFVGDSQTVSATGGAIGGQGVGWPEADGAGGVGGGASFGFSGGTGTAGGAGGNSAWGNGGVANAAATVGYGGGGGGGAINTNGKNGKAGAVLIRW